MIPGGWMDEWMRTSSLPLSPDPGLRFVALGGRRERGSPHPLHLSLSLTQKNSLTHKKNCIMEKYEIDRLRSLPIEDVAERLGLHVTRHKSLCPFHDDHHASLTYSVSRGTFRCFVCDAHGGPIDLVMRLLGKSFPEACRWLAHSTGNMLTEWHKPAAPAAGSEEARPFDATRYLRHFEHPWLSDEARRFLFTERRLDARVVSWCRLTSWTDRQGIHWLQIPYFSTDGRLIGLQNRNLDYAPPAAASAAAEEGSTGSPQPPSAPRFRFPRGARCSIYNLPVLPMLRPGEPLYITEGASDCWAMLSAGYKAVAIPSATLLSRADKDVLQALAGERSTTFHMFPDQDAPGERLFMQLREVLPGLQHHSLPPACKDFSDAYVRGLNLI